MSLLFPNRSLSFRSLTEVKEASPARIPNRMRACAPEPLAERLPQDFHKIPKIPKDCQFWVQNESLYNEQDSRVHNLKDYNFLEKVFFLSFSYISFNYPSNISRIHQQFSDTVPKSRKIVSSEYRMNHFTMGKFKVSRSDKLQCPAMFLYSPTEVYFLGFSWRSQRVAQPASQTGR